MQPIVWEPLLWTFYMLKNTNKPLWYFSIPFRKERRHRGKRSEMQCNEQRLLPGCIQIGQSKASGKYIIFI